LIVLFQRLDQPVGEKQVKILAGAFHTDAFAVQPGPKIFLLAGIAAFFIPVTGEGKNILGFQSGLSL